MKFRINKLNVRVFTVLFCVFSSVGGFAQEISRSLEDFNAVKVYHGLKVVLIPSEENKISISGPKKEEVQAEIVDGTLELKFRLNNIWKENNTLIKVYFDAIETIDANENASVEIKGTLKGDKINIKVQEAASISGSIEASEVYSKAITGGEIHLKGNTNILTVEANTGGKFLGKEIASERVTVTSTTGASANVFASEYAEATAKMGGNIRIFGDPETIDSKIRFGGTILQTN